MFRVRKDQIRAQDRQRQRPGAPAPLLVVRRDLRLRRPAQPHLQTLQVEPSLAPGLEHYPTLWDNALISSTGPVLRSGLTA